MELEKIIYDKFLEEQKESYIFSSNKDKILKLEARLKLTLSSPQTIAYEELLVEKLKLYELEKFELIKFVLKHYFDEISKKK